MKIPKIKTRPLLISLITLLIVPSLVFGTSRGHDYLTVRGLKIEAERLADKGEYREAMNRLAETEGKWTTQNVRNQVQQDVEEYKLLAESTNNFDQARLKYDFKDYQGAIELFKKVLVNDVNYKSAQSWLTLAEKKLAEGEGEETPKGSVAVVKTQTVLPANTSQSSFNTPVPSPKPDDSSKLQAIGNLFVKIGELNGQLEGQKYVYQEILKSYPSCDAYTSDYDRYMECVQKKDSALSSTASEIESLKKQISDINRQIQDIMATCQTNECAKYYQEVVGAFEAKGYVVR